MVEDAVGWVWRARLVIQVNLDDWRQISRRDWEQRVAGGALDVQLQDDGEAWPLRPSAMKQRREADHGDFLRVLGVNHVGIERVRP